MRTAALTASLVLCLALSGPCGEATEALFGELTEGIACRSDPTQTYTLYLPTNYDTSRRWPVLLVFDPRGRSVLAAELFREAAERHGWLIVSSNDTRSDGPMEPNIRAVNALWPEIHTRFPIDPNRIYAAGFSGGATVACLLGKETDGLAGVIASGAPMRKEYLVGVTFAVFGAAGDTDFNYRETRQIHDFLDAQGNSNRWEVFEGTHTWMPTEMAGWAVDWLELDAMRSGRRSKDTALIESIYTQDMSSAEQLEAGGNGLAASRRYRAIETTFAGLREVGEVKRRAATLEASPEVKLALKDEKKWDRFESQYLIRADTTLGAVRAANSAPSSDWLARELRLKDLQRRAAGNGYEAVTAERLLNTMFTGTAFYLTRDFLQQQRYEHVITVLQVALQINEDSAFAWYNLACAQARSRQNRDALDSLERAVGLGFANIDHIQSDPDLESLRGQEGYAKLVEDLRGRSPAD